MKIKKIIMPVLISCSTVPLLFCTSIHILQLNHTAQQILQNSTFERSYEEYITHLIQLQIQQTLKVSLLMLLLTTLFILLFLDYSNRSFFSPLSKLLHSMHAFELGDYNSRFVYTRNNELGEIGIGFNALLDKITQDIRNGIQEKEALQEKATKDALTGLYNKTTTESLIDDFLALETGEILHALFIIDVDNFKSINDTLGHLCGDNVLKDISCSMLQLFRKSDIVGRIGGDEFIIFVKNLSSEQDIVEKAHQLITMFNQCYCDPLGSGLITGSIGIAIYPHHGDTFTQLYQHADNALYTAKAEGKNCFHLLQTFMQ